MGDAKSNTDKTSSKLTGVKQVIKFFCLFLLVYVLLMVPWPGFGAGYSKFYRAAGTFLFGSFGRKGVVCFYPLSDGEYDVKIVFYNRDQVAPDGKMIPCGHIRHNSRLAGYIYAAFVVALILATPIPLRRRVRALFWGLILIHCFIVFKLAIWILYGFNQEPSPLIVLNKFWQQALLITVNVFVHNLTFGFIVSFIIWILVSFRREDWGGFFIQKKDLSKIESEKTTGKLKGVEA